MRICHIIEAAGGGSGQVVMDLAKYGVDSGDDVTVIYAPQRAWPGFVSALTGIQRLKLVPSPMQRKVGGHDFLDAWNLYRALRREGPFDIIHSHSSKAGALTRLVCLFLPHVIKVYSPHGFITLASDASPFYGWIEWSLSFLCNCIVTVSQSEQQHARKLGIPERKIVLVHNGIVAPSLRTREDARQNLGLSPHSCVLGFIGRFVQQKNPLLALNAFFIAAQKHPNLHLCYIGEGPLMSDVKKALDKNPFADRVHLTGSREAGHLVAAFDAILCSSHYEGMPIVFLESLLAGVPIISTQVGGVEETIIEGQTGFTAHRHSPDILASAIEKFLALPQDVKKALHDNCIFHAKHFSLHKMGDTTRRLYERLINENSFHAFSPAENQPLRICHVVEATAGGSARIVVQLIRGSIANGDSVSLIYSPLRADHSFLSAVKDMDALQRYELPMGRNISKRDFTDGAKLYNLLKNRGPFDVIHCHSSKAGALTRIVGLFFPHVTKIYTPHGFFALTPKASKIYSWIEWLLSWLTDGIITVSQREMWLANKKMRISQHKLNTILNGVELNYPVNRNKARQDMGYNDKDYVVGFVGRLVEIKNPIRLIETFRLLAAQKNHLRLAIVGQGPLKTELEIKLAEYGLTSKVLFADNQDARDVIPAFDCLLCTSNTESFGLVLVEALHAGVPVVTTPVGISDLAIVDGQTGYVTDFTPQSLAEGVLKLAALPEAQREEMKNRCVQQAQFFDVKTMIEKTNALYRSLPKSRKRA